MSTPSRAFTAGDICITQNGRTMICDGSLVVVLAIDPTRVDCYLIRRVDGQPWPVCQRKGQIVFGKFDSVYAWPHNLRKPDLSDGWTDQEAIEQRSMQRALERAIFGSA